MAKTEDIEAKLAAYVDGDVDPAGRAEIEKHLASNPRHRELLADLSKQRDLLRALPRDLAQSDVAETINSQLERAVLLGDVDTETEIAGSIGRWSQLRAIAAVLLLTGGLAGVIYYLLPSSNRHNTELADLRIAASPATSPASAEPVILSSADNQARSRAFDDASVAAVAPATEPAVAQTPSRPQIAMADDQMPGGGRGARGGFAPGVLEGFDRRMTASNSMPPQTEVFKEVLQSRSSQVAQKETQEQRARPVYVVSTDNPESTSRDLREYLRNNNIVVEASAPEAMPKPLDSVQQQAMLLSRQQQLPTVQLKAAPDGTVAQQIEPEPQDAARARKASTELIVARQVTPQQFVALKGWLDQRQQQGQVRSDLSKNLAADQPLTIPTEIPGAAPGSKQPSEIAISNSGAFAKSGMQRGEASSASPAFENSPTPTTLPFTLDVGLSSVFDFSPPRLDRPGIELDTHRAESQVASNSKDQMTAAPTTQFQLQPIFGAAPTTLPDADANERVDVVIVLETQSPAIPATLPATTGPSEPAVAPQ